MSSACVCHTDEWCFYCEKYVPLERERDAYKHALEIMDDRKNAMMPRSQMARIAINVIDRFKGDVS